jgi:hypothetical protein
MKRLAKNQCVLLLTTRRLRMFNDAFPLSVCKKIKY